MSTFPTSRLLQRILPPSRTGRRALAVIAGALLLACCIVPRRTESYFRTDLPRPGDRPHNRSPTELPAPAGVESFVNSIGMRMIRVPAGDFVMGSPTTEPGRGKDETQRALRLSVPLYMSQTEVTQGEWNAIMEFNPSRFVGDRLPVQNIRLTDAWVFCNRLTAIDGRKYILPSELEWEYACRSGTLTPYNTGTELLASQARFAAGGTVGSETDIGPRPVGSYPPNAWGLYDMHGNVAECCNNRYSPDNPLDTVAGTFHPYLIRYDDAVFRGGGWDSPATACRSASRDHANRFAVQDTVGFRVMSIEE